MKKRILIIILFLLIGIGIWRVRIGQDKGPEKDRVGDLNFIKIIPSNTPTITPTPTPDYKAIFSSMNAKSGPCRYVPVLMYHHLLSLNEAKKINASWMSVAPEVFDQQMAYLQKKGYQTMNLAEMMSGLKNNSLPPKPIVITFDDGYRELFNNLYPILKKYNFKATLFLISQFIGGERYLDWWQIKEMVNSGLVEIGDHTLNHPSLLKNGEEEEKNQVNGAKMIIEQNLGRQVNVFAYPYGSYNQTSEKILKEGNFVAAVTTQRGNPVCVGLPYEIPRIRIGNVPLSGYGL